MFKVIRNLLMLAAPFVFAIAKLMDWLGHPRAIVLIFHDVRVNERERYRKFIHFLHRHFAFITPEQFKAYLKGEYSLRRTSFLVTYDDGYVSSKEATNLILDPLGIKAVFFCCSDFIGMSSKEARKFVSFNLYRGTRSFEDIVPEEFCMSAEDLRSLVAGKHTIGSHSRDHRELSRILDHAEMRANLLESRQTLQKLSGQEEIDWIAYPFGRLNAIDAVALKEVSRVYTYCFNGIRGLNGPSSHPMCLYRTSVTLSDPFWLQLTLALGGSDFFHYFKRRTMLKWCTDGNQSAKDYKHSPTSV